MTVIKTPAALCGCGKPLTHLSADPDSADWACRVPDPKGAGGVLLPRGKKNTSFPVSPVEAARQDGYDSGYEDGAAAVREAIARGEDTAELIGAAQVAKLIGIGGMHLAAELVPLLEARGGGFPRSLRFAGRRVWWRAEVADWLLAGHGVRWEFRDLGDWLLSMADLDREQTPGPRSTGPVQCRPWCRHGDGHPSATFAEDQRCYTDTLRLYLSLHPQIPESFDGEDYGPGPDYLSVYGVHHPHRAATEVVVQRGDGHEVRFTRDEAGQLVEALQLLLGQTGADR